MNRFFIIGNPRSGTTLFRLMLNKHSQMSVPPEAGFLVWLSKKYMTYDFLNNGYKSFLIDLKNTKKIETWNLNYIALEDFLVESSPISYSQVMDKIYKFYSSSISNKDIKLYGDKNNYYLEYISLLSKLYPNAKFIHIIRDGRSVAASYKGVMQKSIDSKYAPNLPTSMEDIAKEWCSNLQLVENAFLNLNNNQKYTVKYEDIVLNPVETLTQVCLFLGIPFEGKMLEYYKTNEDEGLEPKEYMAWKSKNLQPIKKEEAEKYKILSISEINEFETKALHYLKQYGYK